MGVRTKSIFISLGFVDVKYNNSRNGVQSHSGRFQAMLKRGENLEKQLVRLRRKIEKSVVRKQTRRVPK